MRTAAVAARPGAETTLPPHCHVAGSFERRTGVDGKEYAIGFAINMPANWNGRFMFQGGGGLNGAIREPAGRRRPVSVARSSKASLSLRRTAVIRAAASTAASWTISRRC